LDVRPIYHQKDENSETHLFIGIVAYQLAHGIRKELKKQRDTLRLAAYTQYHVGTNAYHYPHETRKQGFFDNPAAFASKSTYCTDIQCIKFQTVETWNEKKIRSPP
jgi:hypothetical protein